MNDLYLSLANSTLGKNIFEALSLPKPPQLKRSAGDTLAAPSGAIMLAAIKGSMYHRALIKHLSHERISLYTPVFTGQKDALFTNLQTARANNDAGMSLFNMDHRSQRQFKALVIDATGCQTSDDLEALHALLQPLSPRLKANGRVVIISHDTQDQSDPVKAALAAGLSGFVKSLAKEMGKRGITCNIIELAKASERQLAAPLFFLLSPKSTYVTGQSLRLNANGNGPRKFDWQQPLQGKTFIVTGAARGIGRETSLVLARDGATVVALDVPANSKKTRQLAQQINGHAVDLDLSSSSAAADLLEIVASQLGGIDGIIHNAGITRDKTIAKMPQHFWRQVMDINLGKILEINRLLLERSALNAHARLVCISSISGIAGNFGQTNYALSKAAIAGYVQQLAPMLENGATINAVAPGFIETDMTRQVPLLMRELGRRGNSLSQGGLPLDVAEAVSLCCHPAASALNGNLLRVCGQSLLGR